MKEYLYQVGMKDKKTGKKMKFRVGEKHGCSYTVASYWQVKNREIPQRIITSAVFLR